ncbi:MAG: hypothetical protein V1899_02875 [Planctomycetota bacterium]
MNIEFYLLKLYLRPNGWRLSLCEIVNFDNGADWALLSLDFQHRRDPLMHLRIGMD